MRASTTTYCGFWVVLSPIYRVLGRTSPKSGAEPALRLPILTGVRCTIVHTGRMPPLTRKGAAAMATANIQAARPVKTASSNPTNSPAKRFHGRLKVDATFCPTDVEDLFSTVDWEIRSSQIKGENGELIFEQTNCEVPSFWSQLATNVICSKYFYGEVGTPEREYSVRQLVHRVARTIADWGLEDGYFASTQDGERFYRELAWLCLHQHGAFNSPVWFNVGLYHQYGVTGAKCNWRWDPQTNGVKQPESAHEDAQG